jgi:ketosteroid isomerase-like protein
MGDTIDDRASADQILLLERGALDRWGNGDPGGFLQVYADDITYFDPSVPQRVDGHQAMDDYYRPWFGKVRIARYEMLNPQVVIDGNMALLTYNLVNYVHDDRGIEAVGSRWNSTTVYRRVNGAWKTVHSHWSFTRHSALQNITPEDSERQAG